MAPQDSVHFLSQHQHYEALNFERRFSEIQPHSQRLTFTYWRAIHQASIQTLRWYTTPSATSFYVTAFTNGRKIHRLWRKKAILRNSVPTKKLITAICRYVSYNIFLSFFLLMNLCKGIRSRSGQAIGLMTEFSLLRETKTRGSRSFFVANDN